MSRPSAFGRVPYFKVPALIRSRRGSWSTLPLNVGPVPFYGRPEKGTAPHSRCGAKIRRRNGRTVRTLLKVQDAFSRSSFRKRRNDPYGRDIFLHMAMVSFLDMTDRQIQGRGFNRSTFDLLNGLDLGPKKLCLHYSTVTLIFLFPRKFKFILWSLKIRAVG